MIIDTGTLSEMYRLKVALLETRAALSRAIQIERSLKEAWKLSEGEDDNLQFLISEIAEHEKVLKKHEGVSQC